MKLRHPSERAVEQHRRIRESLLQLMGEGDYGQISVMAICGRAGIPRRTFYYYYDSKDQVLDGLLEWIVQECNLESMFDADRDPKNIEFYFSRFFRFWKDSHRSALDALLKNGFGSRLMLQYQNWVLTEGEWLRPVEDLQLELRTIGSKLATACVLHALFYWWECGFRQTPEEMASFVTQILSQPLYRTR